MIESDEIPKLRDYKFMDMHSGGGTKAGFEEIIIQAHSKSEAVEIFKDRYDRDPNHVTCNCCGPDYSYWEV